MVMNSVNRTAEIRICPSKWTKEQIATMPKECYLGMSAYSLFQIWSRLPEILKQDQELQSHLPCFDHYNRDTDQVHIDGPPPPKYRCRGCINMHKNNRRNK